MAGDSMKDNRHKEPRQKPWGQAERIQTGSRLPKTIAREAWVKSKENLIPAKRTNPDSNYAYAQEMEEDSVQQVENCLEDATLLTLQKAGAAYKDRIACKRELHKPHQEGSLYRNTLEPREKETVVREPSKTNPQGTSKQEQQRCTAQKQIEQQVKKVAREIRGVDSSRHNGNSPDGSEKANPKGAEPVQIPADPHPAGRHRGAGEQRADSPEDSLNKQKQPWPDGRGCCPLYCPLRFSTK